MNSNIFYQGIQLDFVEDLENGKASKWVANIPTSQTYTFGLGEADYTITVETTEEIVRIVHDGILDVQNPVVSNYKYEPVVLRNVSPTEDDWDYVNGCIWLSPTEAFVLLRKDKLTQKATWVSLTSTQLPNRDVIEKLTEQDGKLLYEGQEIKPTPKQSIDEQSTHEDIPSAKAVEDRIETFAEEIDSKLADKADLVDGKVPLEQLPSFEEIPSPFELTKAKVEAVLTGDITSHNHATEIGNHNTSETSHNDIRQKVDEAKAIAEGKSRARVFATESALDTWLSNPENVALLQIGDNFYIEETDKPDYWWNGTNKVKLETEKVDLTDYAKTIDLPTKVSDLTNDSGFATEDAVQTKINTHNSSETAHTDIRNAVAEAKAIAEGKSRARVFATKSALDTWLLDSENVALLQIGDNFYIEETDKPDYWWNGTTIKELETQKVDLTEYAKSEDLAPVATTGSYNDLTNTPTIPTIPNISIINGNAESGKYISQVAVDATDKHKLIVTKADLPQGFSGDYDDLTNIPDTFLPSAHDHDDKYYTESEIDTKLGGKADNSHTHTKSEITDFPTTMTPTAHQHTKSEITDFPTIPTIPDITVNNGSAESGKYISKIEVDSANKHKLNITKENLPTLRPTIELEVASLTTLTEAEKLAIRNTLNALIVDDKIDGTKFDDIVLVLTNDLIRMHYSSIDYYVANPQITVIFETENTKYTLHVPLIDYTYSTLTSTTTTIPTISTSITTDATDDSKTASPKAVKTYVDNAINSAILGLLGGES